MSDDTEEQDLDLTTDQLVKAYRKLRARIDEEEEAFKARTGHLKTLMDEVSAKLLDFLNANNLDNVRTQEGTVSRRVSTRYWTSDWDSMYEFIRENDAQELLERRIHNGNMRTFIEENPDLLPKGLQVDNRYIVQVRKPSNN